MVVSPQMKWRNSVIKRNQEAFGVAFQSSLDSVPCMQTIVITICAVFNVLDVQCASLMMDAGRLKMQTSESGEILSSALSKTTRLKTVRSFIPGQCLLNDLNLTCTYL
jgi:hypothetical protein